MSREIVQCVTRGAHDASRRAMQSRSTIDRAFTSVLAEVGRLRDDIDFAAWCRHVHGVDVALGRFCDAIDDPKPTDPPHDRLAREAFMAVLALAQLLAGAYSDEPRTSSALELTQLAVGQLLDALEPYVTRTESEARRVLLDGEPLESALERMFSA
jgi:hypothetical protein